MKKILCLIDTLGFGGGAERQMSGLAGMLHKHGYDVSLATYHKHEYNPILKEKYGIESIIIDTGGNALSKLISVRKFVKSGNFDTIIAYKDGAAMIMCLIKFLGLKCKLIVSERNTTTKLNFKERLKFYLYKKADRIIPNSFAQSKFIEENYPKLFSKTEVITNFTDVNDFTPAEHHEYGDKLNMLVVARIAPQKNVIRFLNVAHKVKEENLPVKIIWYGDLYKLKEYGGEVRSLYESLDIKEVLEFRKPTKDIKNAYQGCDIFCLPSLHEGYPNVVCEAMSCGKPILCSNVCDNPYIVEDGRNGWLLDPLNEEEMFMRIKQVALLPKMTLKYMGIANRVTAQEKFSEEAFIKNYIRLIESL